MIDKVIKLKNGLEYYVLDEMIDNNNRYIFAVQVEQLNDIVTENCIVCKVNGKFLANIDDNDEYERLSNEFIKRLNKA